MLNQASALAFGQLAIEGCLPLPGQAALAPVTPDPWIETWQRHHATDELPIICPSIAETVVDPDTLAAISKTLAEYGDHPVALVFVHRGHQRHYRSPVLPHLLSRLPTFASVMTLRAQDDTIPSAAWRLCSAALANGEACLLLNDRTRRLVDPSQPVSDRGAVDYSLFTPSDQPQETLP